MGDWSIHVLWFLDNNITETLLIMEPFPETRYDDTVIGNCNLSHIVGLLVASCWYPYTNCDRPTGATHRHSWRLSLKFETGEPYVSGYQILQFRSAWQLVACWCQQRDCLHDDVIKYKHFPRHWSFVRGIHRSPANSPHKGQWRGALMFSLI